MGAVKVEGIKYMGRTVAIGIQSFEEMIKGNYFYIDKTSFIKEWWESGDSTTLITRPRRFGKTLNMSMLEQFFSIMYSNRSELFEGLSIWEDETYRELQGTYPVISLSFARVKECDYATTKEKICEVIRDVFIKYEFLKDSDVLSEADKVFFDEVMCWDMKDSVATSAIHKLSNFLYRYYGKKVIILLDEYDTPMQEAYVNDFWEELVAFTRSMLNSTFKTNPYLARAVMTGITRISKESIFSDLNNLEIVTTSSDKYATAFGFTEEEVFEALEEYGLDNEKEKVKYWYDGFNFGKYSDIYNPWSMLNFIDKGKYGTYWANTSSNRLVGKLIREGDEELKQCFGDLLEGKCVECSLDEQIVYNQLDNGNKAIWSLLVASGYLKIVSYEDGDEAANGEEPIYELAITNYEVQLMFRSMVRGWFEKAEGPYNYFIKAMLLGDIKAMNTYMNRLTLQIFSYFDTGKNAWGVEPERFYHGFMLGLLVELNNRYIITSNRESGFGRYDVVLEPRKNEDPAFILEFKVHDPDEERSLEETVQMALAQIEEKQYEVALITKGINAGRIRKYGFAFEGKKVLIG